MQIKTTPWISVYAPQKGKHFKFKRPSVGKFSKQGELLYTATESVNGYDHFGKQFDIIW